MSKKTGLRNTDIAGNSVGSHAAYVRQLVRQAETLLDFERTLDHMFEEEVTVISITVRIPTDDRPEYLAVVRVLTGGGKKVGFHNAATYLDVVAGVAKRLQNKSMKFVEDRYE